MKIKEVKPINFLYHRAETTIGELHTFLPIGQELFKEAVFQKLMITGPIHWHYYGFMGDASQPFTLEISLPIGEVPPQYDGQFHVKRTEPFKCISIVHEGNWLDMPRSYGLLMEHIGANALTPTGNNREIYVNVDFSNAEANVSEIQIGLQ